MRKRALGGEELASRFICFQVPGRVQRQTHRLAASPAHHHPPPATRHQNQSQKEQIDVIFPVGAMGASQGQ